MELIRSLNLVLLEWSRAEASGRQQLPRELRQRIRTPKPCACFMLNASNCLATSGLTV